MPISRISPTEIRITATPGLNRWVLSAQSGPCWRTQCPCPPLGHGTGVTRATLAWGCHLPEPGSPRPPATASHAPVAVIQPHSIPPHKVPRSDSPAVSSVKGNSKFPFHLPMGSYSYSTVLCPMDSYSYSTVLCQTDTLDLHLEHLCLENTSYFSPLLSRQETFL